MTYCLLTFESSHAAIAAEQTLLEAGFPVRMLPLPSALGAGCGLALRFPAGEEKALRREIAEQGLQYQALYRVHPEDGGRRYEKLE